MVLYGKPLAQEIYQRLKIEITKLKVKPSLAVVLVGEDPVSLQYCKVKEKIAENLGIGFKLYHLPGIVLEKNLINLICDLNKNKFISGIVVQLPLPAEFNTDNILKMINPLKDVDGFSGNYPHPAASAILEIIKYYKVDIEKKNIVIVGHGRMVGQPLGKMLEKRGAKPTICDSNTKDLTSQTSQADILISAVGLPKFIKPDMVSQKAIVIDAGTSENSGKVIGDVDPSVYKKVSSYSPVPGGVGPVTVAMLMRNLVEAVKNL